MGNKRVIVVGEGAAGLIAAGQAAETGAKTLLLGKMDRPGYKLCLTGNGRCNLSNTCELPDFIKAFGANGRFLRQAFLQFFRPELTAFFRKLGVDTVTEDNGCIYPASGRARDVVETLIKWNRQKGVEMRMLSPVKSITAKQGRIVSVHTGKDTIEAASVIIATGGASYPSTGSSGDGYRLAKALGHSIVPVRPALVGLETSGQVAARLQGVSLSDAAVRVYVDSRKLFKGCGDILFTHFGVSGPVILSLSRHIVDLLRTGKKVTLSIDLLSDVDEKHLNEKLISSFRLYGRRQLQTLLKEFLPGKLIDVCIDLCGISSEKTGNQITAAERKKLRGRCKNFCLEISGHRPLEEAMVTAGGVAIREIDPRTMQSLKVKGLYFAGEVMDVDGDSGGYNLQAAFSTGWLAGRSAAQASNK